MERTFALTAHALRQLIVDGAITPDIVLRQLLSRIDAFDPKIRAYVHINKDILSNAGVSKFGKGILAGVPIALKDNLCVNGELTTCGSGILKDFKPPYDATVVRKLRSEGAILFGKLNMDEFAFGSSCETSFYGPTFNPWDTSRIPGGSSGGSAAAVAADMAIAALGSDTGGSIRQPASLCGVVGLKPTYGRVSRYGLIAFASSLDQIGPITKDVRDAALILEAIAGHDEMDSTSVDRPVPAYSEALVKNIKGMRIGVPREYFIEGIEPEVALRVKEAIDVLRDLGATIVDITLPHTEYAVSTYYIIAPAEASSNLARFDGVQYGLRDRSAVDLIGMYTNTRSRGFGGEAKRRILLGTYCLSSGYYDAYYIKAQRVRTKIKQDFDNAFEHCECIVTPTSPCVAFKVGERVSDPLSMYLSDVFTIPANLAGIPAISVPCGFSEVGLPVGIQFLAKPFDEEILFRVAFTYEQNTVHHVRRPKIA